MAWFTPYKSQEFDNWFERNIEQAHEPLHVEPEQPEPTPETDDAEVWRNLYRHKSAESAAWQAAARHNMATAMQADHLLAVERRKRKDLWIWLVWAFAVGMIAQHIWTSALEAWTR